MIPLIPEHQDHRHSHCQQHQSRHHQLAPQSFTLLLCSVFRHRIVGIHKSEERQIDDGPHENVQTEEREKRRGDDTHAEAADTYPERSLVVTRHTHPPVKPQTGSQQQRHQSTIEYGTNREGVALHVHQEVFCITQSE